tara:strand:+ start:123 stop:641 length:519 start_codon:yes stop_codon:yes gene_type:complete
MSELRTNRIIPRDGLPSGSSGGIVQIKYAIKNDTQSIGSQGYSETPTDVSGLSVSITPTRSDSKILVQVNIGCHGSTGNAASTFRIYRGSTNITVSAADTDNRHGATVFYNNNQTGTGLPASFSVLDSPATTSATTYKVTGFTNAGTLYVNRLPGDSAWNTISTITAMEVSG